MKIPTRKCWSLLGGSADTLVKPFKYGVVVATCFQVYRPANIATDSRLKGLFAFGRQGALANAEHRANPRQVTDCMVQFLKVGDWLKIEVRGLSRNLASISRKGLKLLLSHLGVGGGCLLKLD